MEQVQENNSKIAVNRFASNFAGAFKTFHLYHQNNKALDEAMENLLHRFNEAAKNQPIIKLGITNRSIVYEGDSVGIRELTLPMAMTLRTLGFKEIIFKSPLQSRHFYKLLHILTGKDPLEVKLEKLIPMISDGDEKPIALISITGNSFLLRMSDEAIQNRLASLSIPQSEDGHGFIEKISATNFENWPDLLTWICVEVGVLDKPICVFVRNLTDAAREGYFPWERYLKVFPLPLPLKEKLFGQLTLLPIPRSRETTPLGLALKSKPRPGAQLPAHWATLMTSFSREDLRMRQDFFTSGANQTGIQELELAEVLLAEEGPNFQLGLRFLNRFLSQQNPVASQEKAIKLGIGIWLKYQSVQDDMNLMTLLSTLRQNLAAAHNINLTLFPLRNLTFEAEMFIKITQYIIFLGEIALPALLQSLEAEQDRSMRKKLCYVITLVARERGVDFLIESIPKSSTLLLRNIVMILGDTRNPLCVKALTSLILHEQKTVRIEAIRSLGKIGSPESMQVLSRILSLSPDLDDKKVALDFLALRKDRATQDFLTRLLQQETQSPEWKKILLEALQTEKPK